MTAYSLVTQRVLRATGKPESWVFALALGVVIALAEIFAEGLPNRGVTTRVWHALAIIAAFSLPFLGAAAGFGLTAREGRSPGTQLGAALALGAAASLAALGIGLLLVCLMTGACL